MDQNIANRENEQLQNDDMLGALETEPTVPDGQRSNNGRVVKNSRSGDAAIGGTTTHREPAADEADGLEDGDTPRLLGRVATPAGMEATVDDFAFWVPEGVPVEATQIVRASARFPSVGDVQFYGVVESVSRRSRRSSVLEERDRYD